MSLPSLEVLFLMHFCVTSTFSFVIAIFTSLIREEIIGKYINSIDENQIRKFYFFTASVS